ncbi:MAG: DUF87 domain-containing protein [Patescibacteria group bacterium]
MGYLIFPFSVLFVGAFLYFYFLIVGRPKLGKLLNLRLLLIRIPKEEKPEPPDLKKEISVTEQLFSLLVGLKWPAVFEAAVHHVGEEIHFYAAVQADNVEWLQRQIQGLWPGAEVKETDDYTVFNPQGSAAGGYLSLKQSFILPIRTYEEAGIDTVAPILSNLSRLNEIGEGAALQVLIKPAPKSAKKSVLSAINQLKKGEKVEAVLSPGTEILKGFSKALFPRQKENDDKKNAPINVNEEAVQALQKKASKPLVEINFRLVASAASQFRANEIFSALSGSFSQFASPLRNEFKISSPRNLNNFNFNFIFRNFEEKQAMILNVEELASLFHLPSRSLEVPRIKWLNAKEAAPPANLPGLSSGGVLIGESVFRGQTKPVYIQNEDRERHLYLIGQTGTGKSTLMTNLIAQDIKNGQGVAIIDPHGDLVNSIIGMIPEERIKDVILFDPTDINRPVGLNMLEYDFNRPEEKTFIVNEMQSIFNRLFVAETMGPMFEQYMRNALLLLMEDFQSEPATLIEVPRVFTDAEWRKKKLARISNPTTIDFWEKEAVKAGGEASLANMTPYITSKFNNFIANDYLRPIIGQPRSSFNFRKVLDEGKILLVNLAKGRLGDINAHLLGMIIVGKILMAAFSRVDLPKEQRRRFFLYIDEFQNFTTDSISIILSEARKYQLSLTVAHQFIAQLTEKIRDSVFGNVGSIVSFRVGIQDADFLKKHFEPAFSVNDLINIENFNAYLRILINGQPSAPFNIKTSMAPVGDSVIGEKARALSRSVHTASREEVEIAIYKRLRE